MTVPDGGLFPEPAGHAELITEARELADPDFSLSVPAVAKRTLSRLADALETARRDASTIDRSCPR